jgi:uncharacterized protein YndB with AHSA1/START domain
MSSSKLTVSMTDPREIAMTRTFDAPRRLVIKAMMTPELVKRWLGGKRAEVTTVEIDARVGGAYKFGFLNRNGTGFYFAGTYQEISEDRIVYTQAMNGEPGAAVVTTTYAEAAGKTTMTVTVRFDSPQLRDMVAATGMADGAGESYDVLEQLIATL